MLPALWIMTITVSVATCYHFVQLCRCLAIRWFQKNPCKHIKTSAWICLLLDQSANGLSTEEVPPVNKTESSSETNDHKKDDYSVFIRNLHPLTTAVEVEVALKKFGPIKQGGLQVRSHKLRNICFAFVEFESLDSRQAAIEASSVEIGGRKAFISVKRTISKANGVLSEINSNTGGFSSGGRGGNFRSNYYNSGRGRGRGRFGFRNSFQSQNVQNKCGGSCSNVTNQATVAV